MFGNFIAYRLDGLPVRGPLACDARRMVFEPAQKLLDTASEAIFISSSSSEVKPETQGSSPFTVHGSRFTVRSLQWG
jgi:hypothetical protein